MDAIEFIEQHLDVPKIIEHYDFDGVSHHGDMIRAKCKIHGGVNSSTFVINEHTGLWYCHAGICGGGSIFMLIEKLEKCTFVEAVRKVAELIGVDIDNLEINQRTDNHLKEIQKWVKTMQSWSKKQDAKEYRVNAEVKSVKKFRDFQPDTLEHFGLGFVDEVELEKRSAGQYVLRNRLAIPIIKKGVQIGMSFRKTKANDYPKWSHQPLAIKTGSILYNYDATEGQSSIVIVEGLFDVWAFFEIGVVAVATYGAHVTNEQYRLLMKTGADLVFAFDGDGAGQEATKKAFDMFKYKANMEQVLFGEDEDPESIEREQLKINYESRIKL